MKHEPEQTPTSVEAEAAAVSVRASKQGLRVHVPVAALSAVVAALVGVGANRLTTSDAHATPAPAATPAPEYLRGLHDLNERLDRIEGEQRGLRTDVGEIRGDVRGLRSEIRGLRSERKAAP